MSIMKRRTLLALVAIAVVLFGLTLNSCKDCNSGKNRGKGKDPLGNGSSEDNLGSGSSTNNSGNGGSTGSSDGGSSADNLGSGSSEDNLGGGSSEGNSTSGNGSSAGNSTDENNPVLPPKERRALTPEEQKKLGELKAELVAAAKKIDATENDADGRIVHTSNIGKAGQIVITKYYDLANAVREDEIWLYWLAHMYMCQIVWVCYLCDEFDAGRIILAEDNNNAGRIILAEDDYNKNKKRAGTCKKNADAHEKKGKAAWGGGSMSLSDRNKLEGLLVPAQQEWEDLVGKENKYREALREYGQV